MLTVNGWTAPAPSGMHAALFDVSQNISRSASGCAVIDRTAAKRRLELTWAHMTGTDLAALLEQLSGFFEVVYPDPQTGTARSMTCYCSEKTTGIMRMQDGNPVWTDVKMTWTER